MLTRGSSFPGTPGSLSQEATEGCASLISSRKLKVTLLSSEWGSTKGGLSTINRELAIQLAKNDNVEVTMYLPRYSEEDKRAATGFSVCLKANEKPELDPLAWLATIPTHCMDADVVIGHGVHLGRQVPLIKKLHPVCKWIQVVHTDPEELGMFKDYADPTVKGQKKHKAEVRLCKLADQVVAVGPKLTEAFACYLRSCGKDQDVINLTPGIFSEFVSINQADEEGETFRVLVFGRGDSEDFHVKGYDIAARAVAKLKDEERSFKLVFVGAPNGEEERVKERFLKEGISPSQLIVRSVKEREQLGEEFCQADLVIMPSRTEGFGLAALEGLSAGLPVLVSGNSGIGKALKKVPIGSHCVIESDSDDPVKWAEAIKAVCRKDRKVRLKEASLLRKSYAETYQWEGQCSKLVEKMLQMIKESRGKRPLQTLETTTPGSKRQNTNIPESQLSDAAHQIQLPPCHPHASTFQAHPSNVPSQAAPCPFSSLQPSAAAGTWHSGLSPHPYHLVALSTIVKKCYGCGRMFVKKFRKPPHNIVVKHVDRRVVGKDGNTGALLYNTDFTNTYYHPYPSHIKRKNPAFDGRVLIDPGTYESLDEEQRKVLKKHGLKVIIDNSR